MAAYLYWRRTCCLFFAYKSRDRNHTWLYLSIFITFLLSLFVCPDLFTPYIRTGIYVRELKSKRVGSCSRKVDFKIEESARDYSENSAWTQRAHFFLLRIMINIHFLNMITKNILIIPREKKTTQKYKTNMSVVNVERVRSIDQLKEALGLSQSQTLKLERERGYEVAIL